MRSGRGFPIAFFNAPVFVINAVNATLSPEVIPVIVKAAHTLSPKPSIPQFSSQSLSFNLYLPVNRRRPRAVGAVVVW